MIGIGERKMLLDVRWKRARGEVARNDHKGREGTSRLVYTSLDVCPAVV